MPTAKKPKRGDPLDAAAKELLAYAHGLPGAWEDHPWPGETVAKVGKKVFVFSGWQVARDARPGRAAPDQDRVWGMSVKLVASHAEATAMPFTEATGYGLGKAGWVSAKFAAGEKPLISQLKTWIRESYLQVAPKKLAAQIDAAPAAPVTATKVATEKPTAKKTVAKKVAAKKKAPAKKR